MDLQALYDIADRLLDQVRQENRSTEYKLGYQHAIINVRLAIRQMQTALQARKTED